MATRAPAGLPSHLVLFDGVCGFCDGAVRWLLAHDAQGRLHFAPLQGPTAAALRERHAEIPEDLETLVLVESDGAEERVWLRSAAMFRLLATLGAPWRWLVALRVLPQGVTDAAYRAFARRRYRWFGQRTACRIPSPAEAARFLD